MQERWTEREFGFSFFFSLSKQNTLIPKQKLFTEMGRGLTAIYIGTATREMELLVMSWAEDHGGEGQMWRVGRRHRCTDKNNNRQTGN